MGWLLVPLIVVVLLIWCLIMEEYDKAAMRRWKRREARLEQEYWLGVERYRLARAQEQLNKAYVQAKKAIDDTM